MADSGLIDASSPDAPDYLDGNPRRWKAEKARQEKRRQEQERVEKFFEDLINDVLLPKGLVTEKEKDFIYLHDNISRVKCFWESWLEDYNHAQKMNGNKLLLSYLDNEFNENPTIKLEGKMGGLPDYIFNVCFYLEKIARFAADFQTEWEATHFSIQKNESGANILVEETDSSRNKDAEQVVYQIWDLMTDLHNVASKIFEYNTSITNELSDDPDKLKDINKLYSGFFTNADAAENFERERFDMLKKYSQTLFMVKDNWEKRLDRTYDGFTDFNDSRKTIDGILDKRLDMINSMYS